MAWNIGANDVANAMGTSVGSGALTLKQAVVIAAFLEFFGAVLVGSHVAKTQRTEIVDPEKFASNPELLMYGMIAALISSAIWITIATYFSMPVSTTHSIVGAIMGFGIAAYGFSAIQVAGVSKIMISWVISPLAGAAIAYIIFVLVRKRILNADEPLNAAKRAAPPLVGIVFFIITLSAIYKGLKNLHLDMNLIQAIIIATIIGFIAAINAFALLKTVKKDKKRESRQVERIFAYLQIISACYVAFAHGANDVGNAVAPLATIIEIARTNSVGEMVEVPIWILILGGIGITIGVLTWGKKVIQTIGKNITDITPSRGFSAEFGAATTVLICSKLGMPISTTHTLVGGVIGVGIAGGVGALDLRVIGKIIVSWLVTLPIAAITTIAIFYLIIGVT
ncbi:MAG: inorganic phosphate transporter [Thermoplasmata archaeon]|nr:MAG: inorganic phosphate transporter [Thermoplasmata archaeon]